MTQMQEAIHVGVRKIAEELLLRSACCFLCRHTVATQSSEDCRKSEGAAFLAQARSGQLPAVGASASNTLSRLHFSWADAWMCSN